MPGKCPRYVQPKYRRKEGKSYVPGSTKIFESDVYRVRAPSASSKFSMQVQLLCPCNAPRSLYFKISLGFPLAMGVFARFSGTTKLSCGSRRGGNWATTSTSDRREIRFFCFARPCRMVLVDRARPFFRLKLAMTTLFRLGSPVGFSPRVDVILFLSVRLSV